MKIVKKILILLVVIYVGMCAYLFFFQETFIFLPEKMDASATFDFKKEYKEININVADEIALNGVLFEADSSRGLVLFLHGNIGAKSTWEPIADVYNQSGYDTFILDYRGYGKSGGEIVSQKQFYNDIQIVYDHFKTLYTEDHIVVVGYSVGTGAATYLASTNKPKLLILKAPYYNLTEIMQKSFPIIPTFILKYKFATNEYIQNCTMPVVIFHGDGDELIDYQSALRLQKLFKPQDTLITLKGHGHGEIAKNNDFRKAIKELLQ